MEGLSTDFSAYAYSVVHAHCLDNFSHIHELGHNFGANHDKRNAASSKSEYGFAYRTCDDDAVNEDVVK